MTGLLQTLSSAPAERAVFAVAAGTISAGRIRQTATNIAAKLPGQTKIYLHTASAALFLAGLLAAARKGLAVHFPAHLQHMYLKEIGASDGIVLTDQDVTVANVIPLVLAPEEESPAAMAGIPDVDMLFYTSGVTGTPKLVPKRIAQLDREARVLEQMWGSRAGHVFATVSHQHIYGMLFRVFWPVTTGRLSEDSATEYWESLSGKLTPDTTLISSPAHLTRLGHASVLAGSAPGLIFSSGAPLPEWAAQAAREQLNALPIEVLGSTETGGIAWRQQDEADALWAPLPGVALDTDESGQLRIASPFAGNGEFVETGDLIERAGEKFRLKGRSNRVAKIEGKRVSLVRVEEAVEALAWVEAAAVVDLPKRKGALGAIVELNAEGRAALAEQGAFQLSRRFRAELANRLEPAERPKHWRFGAIAFDRQGKRVESVLRAQFETRPVEFFGDATVTELSAETALVEIEFLPEMIWFEGHFPGQPVLPGIAQVHLAIQWAQHVWDWSPQGAHLSRLKFRRVIRPNDKTQLTLVRDTVRQRLSFAYRLGDIVASEGTIGGIG